MVNLQNNDDNFDVLKFCPNCGIELKGNFNFCPNCGTKLTDLKNNKEQFESKTKEEDNNLELEKVEIVICSVCGEENPIDTEYCESCGSILDKKNIKIEDPAKRIVESPKKEEKSFPQKENKKIDIQVNQEKKSNIDRTNLNKNKQSNKKSKKNKIAKPIPQNTPSQKNFGLAINQILAILGVIVLLGLIILYTSGAFDKKVTNPINQQNINNNNSGIDLNSLQRIEELEKQVAVNPQDENKILELANLLHDSGFFDRAIENYKKYLELKPNNTNALVDMGICYFELQKYTEADSVMKIAVRIDPQHQQANFNLGIVNLAAGKVDDTKNGLGNMVINPNSEIGKKAEQILQSH